MARKIVIIVFTAIGVASILRTLFLLFNSYPLDFHTYYYAADALIHGQNPYNIFIKPGLGYLYPPISLIIFIPLLLFPFTIASNIWLIFSSICSLVALYFFYRVQKLSFFSLSIIFLAFTSSFPFKFTLGMGQINMIVLLILCISILYYKKYNYKSAVALIIASSIKIFPVIYFLLFFLKKTKNILLFSLLLGIMLLIPELFIQQEFINTYFLRAGLEFLSPKTYPTYYDQSIAAMGMRLGLSQLIVLLIRLAVILSSVVVVIWNKNKFYLNFSLLTIAVLLSDIFTWQHHLIFLLIPFYFSILNLKKDKFISVILFLSYVLIAYNIKHPENLMSLSLSGIILSHATVGMIILWGVIIFQIFDIKTTKGERSVDKINEII